MIKKEQFDKQKANSKAALALVLALLIVFSIIAGCSNLTVVSPSPSTAEELPASDIPAESSSDSPKVIEPRVANEHAINQEASQQLEDIKPNITEEYYSDLQHGEKGAAFQRYIVLHDTEGGGTPEGVVSYWEGNGNLIAAHFVIGKDGHIVQCVPLDAIAHHAGWGSGDANVRFGIKEDGRDDLLGRQPTSYYTDYGMNSWSIGIEMVHVGGEGDYPVEQLDALDALIAYIDAYYGGYGGEIIDHKMWREGNSDTSSVFKGYLVNYRDHRTHN